MEAQRTQRVPGIVKRPVNLQCRPDTYKAPINPSLQPSVQNLGSINVSFRCSKLFLKLITEYGAGFCHDGHDQFSLLPLSW